MFKKYIFKGGSVVVGTLSISLSNFFISTYLAKNTDLNYLGEYIFYQALFLAWIVLSRPNTWQSIIKYSPGNQLFIIGKLSLAIEVIACVISSILTLLVLVVFFIDSIIVKEGLLLISIILPLGFLINNNTVIGVTRFEGNFHIVSLAQLISGIAKCVITYNYATSTSPIYLLSLALMIEIAVWFIFLIYVFYNLRKKTNIKYHPLNFNKKDFVSYSFWGTIHASLDLPVNYLDKLIVGFYLGSEYVGALDIIKRISQLVGQIAVPINTIILPYFSKMLSTGDLKKTKLTISKLFIMLLILSVIIFLIFASLFKHINLYLFAGSISEFKMIVLGYLSVQLLALCFIWVHPLCLICSDMKHIARIIFSANSLYLVIILLFIKNYTLGATLIAFFVQVTSVITLKLTLAYRQRIKA